jgi:predicted nucleic acid-binding protein
VAPQRGVILADASALVAALDERDRNHSLSVELLQTMRGAHLLATSAAFREATYSLGSRLGWPGHQALCDLVERDVLRVAYEAGDWIKVARLMAKYRDTPMALADAQLIALADELDGPPIFTFDSDFTIYRLRNGAAPEMLPRPGPTCPETS